MMALGGLVVGVAPPVVVCKKNIFNKNNSGYYLYVYEKINKNNSGYYLYFYAYV
jgi:hypothetical protein